MSSYFSLPFSLFPPAPPARPPHQVELWACPKWMLRTCRMCTSCLLFLVSIAPGQTCRVMFFSYDCHSVDYHDPADDTDGGNCAFCRDEMGLMSCDDISRYSMSSQSGSKGSEAVSYYLDQDSGQYFSLLEGDGPAGPDYDRSRNTGVRRRDKTPTHGETGERNLNGAGSISGFECDQLNCMFTSTIPPILSPCPLCCASLVFTHIPDRNNTRLTVSLNTLQIQLRLTGWLCPPLSRDGLLKTPLYQGIRELQIYTVCKKKVVTLNKRLAHSIEANTIFLHKCFDAHTKISAKSDQNAG